MTTQTLSGRPASEYWSQRFRRHGHTGDTNAVIYAYDQEHRVAAIEAAVLRAGRSLSEFRRALDVGCGTGDFSGLLLDRGVAHVTGLDCSVDVVALVRERFEKAGSKFSATCGAVEACCPEGPFDLVLSVDALQHVIEDAPFDAAVANLCRVAEPGALVIVCEHSTPGADDRPANEYVIVRARHKYLEAFTKHGCTVRGVYGIPRVGVRLCRALSRAAAAALGGRGSPAATGGAPIGAAPSRARAVYGAALRVVLACTRPVDNRLFPFPSRLTDMAIVVFEKRAATAR